MTTFSRGYYDSGYPDEARDEMEHQLHLAACCERDGDTATASWHFEQALAAERDMHHYLWLIETDKEM